MATVKVLLKQNKGKKNGEMPIYLRIIKDRKAKFISTGIYVLPGQWNEDTSRVRKSHRNSTRLNAYIAQKVAEAEGVALELETRSKTVSSSRLKSKIMGIAPVNFFDFADDYLAKVKQRCAVGTWVGMKAAIQKLKEYKKGQALYMDELTVSFLSDYQNYLISELGNNKNTIFHNFKKIRQIVHEIIRQDKMSMDENPFLRFKFTQAPTHRSYLTEDELIAIEELRFKPGSRIFHHCNMYVFSAYAGGLRISDVLKLKWQNFDGERVNLKIQKTSETLSVMLPNKALEIIHYYIRYKSKVSDFIFPVLKNDKDYSDPVVLHKAISSATALCNEDLKEIAFQAKVKKSLSFHTARHTFATRALRKGMRIEYVSKIMGHSDITETQIYTKIINSELEKAMDVFND
jgi:site-specific recombinase XerD